MRYTERHGGVAVIKDKSKHKEAMEKLAQFEEAEATGCKGCMYEDSTKQLLPCRMCKRDKEDKYENGYKEKGE